MARERLEITFDCDDVLVPTAEAIVNDYNIRFGTSIGLQHMYAPVNEDWGVNEKDEAIERVNEFLRSEEHASIPPDPEAVFAVGILAKHHNLHLVTGRTSFLEPVTRRLLDEYFNGQFQTVEHTNFIVPSTSEVVRRSKGEVCREIGADIHIDDHFGHGVDTLRFVKKAILFKNFPWSQPAVLPEGMVRCHNWQEVIEEVEKSASGR